MTPMVDVTFLLLIFFMVTASFQLQRSIEAAQPQVKAGTPILVDPSPLALITVDQRGGFWIRCDAWEREVVGKQSLVSSLREMRSEFSTERVQIEIDAEAKLQSLVDALDAVSIAGIPAVTMTTLDHSDSLP